MDAIPVTEGQVLSLKVINILQNKKQFQKGTKLAYRHDITLQDKEGRILVGEYINDSPAIGDSFIQGVYQYVKIKYTNTQGVEIVPGEATGAPPSSSRMETAKKIAAAAGLVDVPSEKSDPQPRNCYSIKIAGESITFSVAYAKDILVAEIGRQPAGYKVTAEDIDRMLQMADQINNAICDRLNF